MNLNMVSPGPNPYCIVPMDHPARGYTKADTRETFRMLGWQDQKFGVNPYAEGYPDNREDL